MTTTDPENPLAFSRERAAGYSPEILAAARVLVVGAGALGQNVIQALVLSGVGETVIVDPDRFESHNRTRSPFFPVTAETQERFGLLKAPTVAQAALAVATCPGAVVRSYAGFVEELGQGVFGQVQAVVSCVDSDTGRAYLAAQARRFGVPFVEAGFEGAHVTFSVFANQDPTEPCWRCSRPHLAEGGLSCTAYARLADAQGITPALQTGSATLAGLQSEAAIRALHGELPLAGARVHLNVRTGEARTVLLAQDPDCPGVHGRLAPERTRLELEPDARVRDVLARVGTALPDPTLALPHGFVFEAPCRICGRAVRVDQPAWRLRTAPTCAAPCAAAETCPAVGCAPVTVDAISSRSPADLLERAARELGLGPLAVFEAVSRQTGAVAAFEIAGALESEFLSAEREPGVNRTGSTCLNRPELDTSPRR